MGTFMGMMNKLLLFCLIVFGMMCVSGCSEEKEPETPYIYCLEDPTFLFPLQLAKRFEAQETEIQLSDGMVISTIARSYLVFYQNFRFDLDIFVDCYLQQDEPFCDSTYTIYDKLILALEGRFDYNQNTSIKLTPVCFPSNSCVDINIETLSGNGTLYIDRATDDFWEDATIDYQYTLKCEVGFNPLTDEYFPIGQKASIEIELPLKNGEKFKAFFES